MEKVAIGIDLGGTNLKGIIMDQSGRCFHSIRVPTDAQKGGIRVLQNILSLIEMLLNKIERPESVIGIGIGSPGFIDVDGTVLGGAENIYGWKGIQIYKPIYEKFGLKAIAANDATVMAFAEAKYGIGKGINNIVCFVLGTGIGGGIIIDGKLYKGKHGMAGELGHIIVETNGKMCNCGQKGCVEQYASAPAIVRCAKELCAEMHQSNQTDFVNNVYSNPDCVTSKMIYEYVNTKDPVAILVNERISEMLARAIGIVINILSPERIILGGGVMMAGQVIMDTVAKYVPLYCWPEIWERCDIKIAQLGENAGVLGAAAMAFEELRL